MARPKEFEIAIIGGGIAGITLAAALSSRSIPFKIYEQAPAFGEIGAGVSFSPNAVQAMRMCHEGVHRAFEKVCTRNLWPSKQKVWFDYADGFHDGDSYAFSICNELGQNGVHRARFLDEMIKLLPEGVAQFSKRLLSIDENASGRLRMNFEDGTTAEADAIVGCDGIKSRVRQCLFGAEHPCARPLYSHKYAYRGLVPMEKATEVIGEERAQNACMHMGPGGHVLTFPVEHGKILNIVAFKTDPEEWPDHQKLTRTSQREDLLRDFGHYSKELVELLSLTNPKLDVWAIFDLMENPPPSYSKGRICIMGDAAHATSPHHGAGAGLCIEDSAMLAELLADDHVTSPAALEAVCATFDAQRRARGEFLMQSSRFIGDTYEWRAEGVGNDFQKIEAEINWRNDKLGNINMAEMCEVAKAELRDRLGATSRL